MPKKPLFLGEFSSGQTHILDFKPPTLSIGFLLESSDQADAEFPRFSLRSDDGTYQEELSPGDAVTRDDLLQIRFEGLLPRRTYTLTMKPDPQLEEEVFRGLPYQQIIDQPRNEHARMRGMAFAEIEVEETGVAVESWEASQ